MKMTPMKWLLGGAAAVGAYLLYKHEDPGTYTVTLVSGQLLTHAARAGEMIKVFVPPGFAPPILASGNLVATGIASDGSVTFTAPANPSAQIASSNGAVFAAINITASAL